MFVNVRIYSAIDIYLIYILLIYIIYKQCLFSEVSSLLMLDNTLAEKQQLVVTKLSLTARLQESFI